MRASYGERGDLVTRRSRSTAALPGSGMRSRAANRRATLSKSSPTRHDLARPAGFTLLKTRRIRWPPTGVAGKLSMCSRVSSFRQELARPAISTGRKLVRPSSMRSP